MILHARTAEILQTTDAAVNGALHRYGIMVLTLLGHQIAEVTGFTDPTLFALFELDPHIDW